VQDKTGPACGKVPFTQLFSLFSLSNGWSGNTEKAEGVSNVAPGAIVKQIRSSTGLSQRSFAESIGICQSAIVYYESGKHRISDVIWERIKSVYHDHLVKLGIPEEIPELSKKELPPEAETLRRIRCASGLSQREFAESIGVSKSTIGNCEIGMQGISDQIWARIKEKYPHNGHHEAGIDGDHNGQDDDRDQDDGQMAVDRRAPAIIIQSQDGREINPEEIIARVGEVDSIYVRVDHNAAYWVRGEETGQVSLW
jgi:DNA-binding transcriptional regulator YiaG